MTADRQVFTLTVLIFTVGQAVGQAATSRADASPRQIAGYPVDSGYRLQDRRPQQFTPVSEESSREQQQQYQEQARQQQQQYQEQARQQQQQYQEQARQQQQQQQPLFTPEQQQALLQQHYQAYAQLLNQQQQYLSSAQQQQVQQRVQLPQQFQKQPQQFQQQPQQLQQLPQQLQQQQLRQPSETLASTVALLGVKYSAAPSVARTIYRTNNGVNFSY